MLKTGIELEKYSRNLCEGREEMVYASILRSPGNPKSLRLVEFETVVLKSLVQSIFKKNKINVYKIHLMQNILEDGPDSTIELRSYIIQFHEFKADWHMRIVFSGESTLYRNVTLNEHNCIY